MLLSRVPAMLLTFCAVLAVVSCGGDDPEPAPTATPSAPTASAPKPGSTPTEAPDARPGQAFTADPALVNARPIPFGSWTRLTPDRIAIHFETGIPACYGVDATVTESETAVTIELRTGTRADAVDKMCTMQAVLGTLEIQLSAPLGERKVLSAA